MKKITAFALTVFLLLCTLIPGYGFEDNQNNWKEEVIAVIGDALRDPVLGESISLDETTSKLVEDFVRSILDDDLIETIDDTLAGTIRYAVWDNLTHQRRLAAPARIDSLADAVYNALISFITSEGTPTPAPPESAPVPTPMSTPDVSPAPTVAPTPVAAPSTPANEHQNVMPQNNENDPIQNDAPRSNAPLWFFIILSLIFALSSITLCILLYFRQRNHEYLMKDYVKTNDIEKKLNHICNVMSEDFKQFVADSLIPFKRSSVFEQAQAAPLWPPPKTEAEIKAEEEERRRREEAERERKRKEAELLRQRQMLQELKDYIVSIEYQPRDNWMQDIQRKYQKIWYVDYNKNLERYCFSQRPNNGNVLLLAVVEIGTEHYLIPHRQDYTKRETLAFYEFQQADTAAQYSIKDLAKVSLISSDRTVASEQMGQITQDGR
jgi:hypothetical protein